MTINEMVKQMENNLKEINAIRKELKFKKDRKHLMPVFERVIKHCVMEWYTMLTQRVITNYKKAEIQRWLKQSEICLNRVKRVASAQ
jgi:hypothetical protein